MSTEEKMGFVTSFIGLLDITDEDLKQELYLAALESRAEDRDHLLEEIYTVHQQYEMLRIRREDYLSFENLAKEISGNLRIDELDERGISIAILHL